MSSIVIRGGQVVDGTGRAGYSADVLVRDGRIAEIGSRLSGDTTLDASGAVVAPGFIDIHTHYDAQVFWDPGLTPSCFHGVTTVVAGNCGFTIAPTREADRETIALTLEKVEDMNPATPDGGHSLGLRDLPGVPRLGRAAGHGAQLRGLRRPHGAPPLPHGRRRLRTRGDAGRDRRDVALGARGDGGRCGRARDEPRADPRRHRGQAGLQPPRRDLGVRGDGGGAREARARGDRVDARRGLRLQRGLRVPAAARCPADLHGAARDPGSLAARVERARRGD